MTGITGAVILGTGVAELAEPLVRERIQRGSLECGITEGGIALILRHSKGHKVAPDEVDYAGIAAGLKELGARRCLASAAVGSLRDDWPAGTLAVCTDFIDLSGRRIEMRADTVQHRDFSNPFPLARSLLGALQQNGQEAKPQCVYVCVNGPRYETPAEARAMRLLGGDVVGMTIASEAIACREANIAYGCLAVVTNQSAGGDLDHADVANTMRTHGPIVLQALLNAASEPTS